MNSLEYIKMRVAEPTSAFDVEELNDSYCLATKDFFKEGLPFIRKIKCLINGQWVNINLHIDYNPDADYTYFTCDECSHDGTLCFTYELIDKVLKNVTDFITTDSRVEIDYSDGMDVFYTIGDLVISNQHDEKKWATKDKPWITSHTIVFLPIIFSVK